MLAMMNAREERMIGGIDVTNSICVWLEFAA
jgi:hypothetical protein